MFAVGCDGEGLVLARGASLMLPNDVLAEHRSRAAVFKGSRSRYMCGLCGEIRFSPSISTKSLTKMMEQLTRRGPDASGLYVQQGIALGHRRLSILDLSTMSQQPMVDPALGLSIAFNGCIYNFKELRATLQSLGFQFFSSGDTEVILKAYAAWGPSCVERFIGMFAFAIWERDSGRVMLARDRLGIKPLYYADVPGGVRFASTLPAIVAAGDVDTSIDLRALHHYMSWHSVIPAPMTIFNGVKKLAPATTMTIEPDGRRVERVYWAASVGSDPSEIGTSEDDWRERVSAAFDTAVQRRMVADVPVGVLLSGGLDSSMLVAALAEHGQEDLKTFSIGFESSDKLSGDEFFYSDRVARDFGTDHTKITFSAGEISQALPATIEAMSEPMMSHDAVGFYLLSREVSKSVKVVQSGQGADEIFAGYHWYPKFLRSNDIARDYARVYFDRDHEEMANTLKPEFVDRDYSMEFLQTFFEGCNGNGSVDKALQLDSQIMLVDDPVKRVDNMTMAWGLEGRVPFLDHELVELACAIPTDLKLRNGGKHILKEAARRYLPSEIVDREKGYFPVPSLKHLDGPTLDYVCDVLSDPRARQRGLFNADYVDRLLDKPEEALTPKGHSKLWQIAVMEQWLQARGV